MAEKYNNCLECPHIIKEDAVTGNFYNVRCSRTTYSPSNSSARFIKCYVSKVDPSTVLPPIWCPFLDPSKKASQASPAYTHNPYNKWNISEFHVSWDDIEQGQLYRIPFINGIPGKTVKIYSKTNYCIIATELDSALKETNTKIYIYQKDIKLSHMVPYRGTPGISVSSK